MGIVRVSGGPVEVQISWDAGLGKWVGTCVLFGLVRLTSETWWSTLTAVLRGIQKRCDAIARQHQLDLVGQTVDQFLADKGLTVENPQAEYTPGVDHFDIVVVPTLTHVLD